MGIVIHCGRTKTMDMGYVTFDHLRIELARALNPIFGEAYKNWLFYGDNNLHFEIVCNDTPELTKELLEFFMMSDCNGKISSKTSKQLVPLIEKLPGNYIIGYVGKGPYDREYILDFFKYSVEHHANVLWD